MAHDTAYILCFCFVHFHSWMDWRACSFVSLSVIIWTCTGVVDQVSKLQLCTHLLVLWQNYCITSSSRWIYYTLTEVLTKKGTFKHSHCNSLNSGILYTHFHRCFNTEIILMLAFFVHISIGVLIRGGLASYICEIPVQPCQFTRLAITSSNVSFSDKTPYEWNDWICWLTMTRSSVLWGKVTVDAKVISDQKFKIYKFRTQENYQNINMEY